MMHRLMADVVRRPMLVAVVAFCLVVPESTATYRRLQQMEWCPRLGCLPGLSQALVLDPSLLPACRRTPDLRAALPHGSHDPRPTRALLRPITLHLHRRRHLRYQVKVKSRCKNASCVNAVNWPSSAGWKRRKGRKLLGGSASV